MKKELITSIVGVLIIIIISILSSEFGDIDFSLLEFNNYGILPFSWSAIIIIAMLILCSMNKGLTFNKYFLWNYVTYITGKILGILILYFIFNETSEELAFSYSTFVYGDGTLSEIIPRIINFFTKYLIENSLLIDIIKSLYKGVVVALIISAIMPNKVKNAH